MLLAVFCCCHVPHGLWLSLPPRYLPALHLAGAALYLVARSQSNLTEVSERCKEAGAAEVHTLAMDIMDTQSISHLAEKLGRSYPSLVCVPDSASVDSICCLGSKYVQWLLHHGC